MNDRIIELAIQAMAESCAHFGEDIPTQAEHDELYSDEESKWFFKRFAELVRNEAQQPAPVQEPVVWYDGRKFYATPSAAHMDCADIKALRPLYEAPQAQQPVVEPVPMLTDEEIDVALHVALPSLPYDSEDAFINGMRAGEQLVRQKAGIK